MTAKILVLYAVCFACNGSGKEPDYFGERVCIWCEGKGRRRARRSNREPTDVQKDGV